MKKEIGSEFWNIPICQKENDIFSNNTKWFLSGRTAIKYIIKDSGIKSISMPIWCCDSMILPFKQAGVLIKYYSNMPTTDCDAIFIMDYFGFTDQFSVPEGYKGIVIRDLTHSIFSKKYTDADYYFGSLRKWAGFYTGGFAWGNWRRNCDIQPTDSAYVKLRKKAMKQKAKYISGEDERKDYLTIYKKANDMLNDFDLLGACPEDIESAKHFDVDFVRETRRRNAQILINNIGCIFELKDTDCPLFVPIKTKYRNELRKFLIEHNIYCPVHWPNFDLDGEELSLICDQRYDEEDMELIVSFVKQFMTTKEKRI